MKEHVRLTGCFVKQISADKLTSITLIADLLLELFQEQWNISEYILTRSDLRMVIE